MATTSSSSRSTFAIAAVGVALVGAIARLLVYARGLSLWNDEAMVALNIGRRGFGALLTPLAYDQAAPVLYLWAAHIATVLGGVNEYTLRLPAFVAGVLLPFGIWFVGRRIVGEPAAMAATALAALSPTLIDYSNQVKPYSSDALVALLVIWLAWRVRETPTSRSAWTTLALGGVVAVLMSYTAVFVLLACGVFLIGSPGLIRAAGWRMPFAAAATWAVGTGAIYLLFMRAAAGSPYLHMFWGNAFLTPQAGSVTMRIYLAVRAFMGALPIPTDLLRPRLLLPIFLLGVVALWRTRDWAVAALCVTALLAVCVASMANRYPVATRLLLFAAPFTCLIVGSAIAFALSPLERRWRGATAIVALLVPVALMNSRLTRYWRIQATTEGKGAVAAIMSARGTEPVYVAPAAVPLWTFYSTNWSRPDTRYLDSVSHLATSGGISFAGGPSRGRPVQAEEGRALTFRRDGVTDLIGVRTGNAYFAGADLRGAVPDSGWAQEEAARMLATCGSHVWIVSAVRVRGETEPLLRALRSAGARLVYRFDELAASAVRVALPAPAAPQCAAPVVARGVASR
ncbi:MAG TPA: glycosyltransferase family 39 protein [Gemmatimonadaceae bacterium]